MDRIRFILGLSLAPLIHYLLEGRKKTKIPFPQKKSRRCFLFPVWLGKKSPPVFHRHSALFSRGTKRIRNEHSVIPQCAFAFHFTRISVSFSLRHWLVTTTKLTWMFPTLSATSLLLLFAPPNRYRFWSVPFPPCRRARVSFRQQGSFRSILSACPFFCSLCFSWFLGWVFAFYVFWAAILCCFSDDVLLDRNK